MGFFIHKRHSIARPHGRAMGCVVRIFHKIDGVIRALYCIYVYICVCACVYCIYHCYICYIYICLYIYNLTINTFYMKTEWLLMICTEEFIIKQEENALILVRDVSPCMFIYIYIYIYIYNFS